MKNERLQSTEAAAGWATPDCDSRRQRLQTEQPLSLREPLWLPHRSLLSVTRRCDRRHKQCSLRCGTTLDLSVAGFPLQIWAKHKWYFWNANKTQLRNDCTPIKRSHMTMNMFHPLVLSHSTTHGGEFLNFGSFISIATVIELSLLLQMFIFSIISLILSTDSPSFLLRGPDV